VNVRSTSLIVWDKIQESLPKTRRDVWNILEEKGECTGAQVEKYLRASGIFKQISSVRARIKELVDMKLAESTVKCICPVTGELAFKWRALINPNFIPFAKTKKQKQIIKEAIQCIKLGLNQTAIGKLESIL
jgi:hypothetical protein